LKFGWNARLVPAPQPVGAAPAPVRPQQNAGFDGVSASRLFWV
jgi:hypothetical protein